MTPFGAKDNSFQIPLQPTETKMEEKQEVEIIIADIRLQSQARSIPVKFDRGRLLQVVRFLVTHDGHSTLFQQPELSVRIKQNSDIKEIEKAPTDLRLRPLIGLNVNESNFFVAKSHGCISI